MRDGHIDRARNRLAHAGRSIPAVDSALERMAAVARIVAPVSLRIALALPFFKSGLTKWDGFMSLAPTTSFLFAQEFKLHIVGHVYDLPASDLLALATATAEIILPILLIVGLATRFSALSLLGMTGVIQLIVPDGWANFHLPWATMAIALIAIGPGLASLDHLLRKRFKSPSAARVMAPRTANTNEKPAER